MKALNRSNRNQSQFENRLASIILQEESRVREFKVSQPKKQHHNPPLMRNKLDSKRENIRPTFQQIADIELSKDQTGLQAKRSRDERISSIVSEDQAKRSRDERISVDNSRGFFARKVKQEFESLKESTEPTSLPPPHLCLEQFNGDVVRATEADNPLAIETVSMSSDYDVGSPTKAIPRLKKDLEKQKELVQMLTSQLISKGVQPIMEIISYSSAQDKLKASLQNLMNGDETAESEFTKWDEYVRNHPEYKAQEENNRKEWMLSNTTVNYLCRNRIRALVPCDITHASLQQLEADLPKPIAQRVWTRKALWLTRMRPQDIAKLHFVDLRSKYSVQGLDEVELRAVWASLPDTFENDHSKEKETWKKSILEGLMTKNLLLNDSSNEIDCHQYIDKISRHQSYKNLGTLWPVGHGPYDVDAPLLIPAVHISLVTDPVSKPQVSKLTPTRRKTLSSISMAPALSKGPNPKSMEKPATTTCPEESQPPLKRERTGAHKPLVGGSMRSVMEEIMLKALAARNS